MKPEELWNLPPDEFNKWRRENDLRDLFACFQKRLPHFDEWLTTHSLTVDFILNTDKPGQFFYWTKDVYVVKSTDETSKGYFFVPVEDKEHEKQILHVQKHDEAEQQKFRPYLSWAKEKLKTDKILDGGYGGLQDTFRWGSYYAPDVPELCSATLSIGKTVLKLGGCKIEGWGTLVGRNLDFTNLDWLEIDGDFHWSRGIEVFYSTCRHFKAINSDGSFVKFYQCHFEQLSVCNSKLYWVEFFDCEIFKAYFENASLRNIRFSNTSLNFFSFNRTECENIMYEPPKKEYYTGYAGTCETVTENYKRFRVLYQSNGLRDDASRAYYKERVFELKYLWYSSELFKSFTYLWKRNIKYGLSAIAYNISRSAKIAAYSFSFLIWGFGERPGRTLFFSVAVVSTYTMVYYWSGINSIGGDIINSLYLSTIMFTTLGFGDFNPFQSGAYKLVLASEAIIGLFTAGLFIAGYANKSKF